MKKLLSLFALMLVAACGDSTPLFSGNNAPDATAVLDAPPLTIPPDLTLRPPQQGNNTTDTPTRAPAAPDQNVEDLLFDGQQQPTSQNAGDDSWILEQTGKGDATIRQQLAPKPAQTDTEKAAESPWWGSLWGDDDPKKDAE